MIAVETLIQWRQKYNRAGTIKAAKQVGREFQAMFDQPVTDIQTLDLLTGKKATAIRLLQRLNEANQQELDRILAEAPQHIVGSDFKIEDIRIDCSFVAKCLTFRSVDPDRRGYIAINRIWW